jgi:hypothetical protein
MITDLQFSEVNNEIPVDFEPLQIISTGGGGEGNNTTVIVSADWNAKEGEVGHVANRPVSDTTSHYKFIGTALATGTSE